MNRSWIVLSKIENLDDIPPLSRLWYAESNSPDNGLRLSGRPEGIDAIKILLGALPPTYDKKEVIKLVGEAVEDTFM